MDQIEKIQDAASYNAREMTDAQLRDDWRIASGWYATILEGRPFVHSKETVEGLAEKIVAEIIARQIATFHPETESPASRALLYKVLPSIIKGGLYLVEPHGKWAADGSKTLIVKSRMFEGELSKPLFICSDGKIYGVLVLNSIRPISLDDFPKLQEQHRITDAERQEWWGGKKTLYAYNFYLVAGFPKPWEFDLPAGAQTFIQNVEITSIPESVTKATPTNLTVDFYGTKGLVGDPKPGHEQQTLTVIDTGGSRIMVDCGETWEGRELPAVDAILITHAHPDHIGGLSGRELDTPVYLTKLSDELMDRVKYPLKRMTVEPMKWNEIAGALVRFIPVSHSLKSPSFALQINAGGVGILVATDVLAIPERDTILGGTDIYIGDGSAVNEDFVRRQKDSGLAYGHASIRRQIRWLAKSPVRTAIFTHLGPEALEMGDEALEGAVAEFCSQAGYDGKVIVVKDGASLKVTMKAAKAEGEIYDRAYFAGQHFLKDYDILGYAEIIPRLEGGSILDVGCGLGKLMGILKASGYQVTGVDDSAFSLGECKRKGLKVQKGAAEALPFEDGSFDSVVSTHVLEHASDFRKAFTESIRVAKFRAVHVVPLGLSGDFTHKQIFKSLDDLREKFGFTDFPVDISFAGGGVRGHCQLAVVTAYKDSQLSSGGEIFKNLSDFVVVPDFICMVGSAVKKETSHDVDIVFRSYLPGADIKFRNLLPETAQKNLHTILNPMGPHDTNLPLFDLVAVKKTAFKVRHLTKADELRPLQFFTPLKTSSGYTLQEFGDWGEFWEKWAKPLIDQGTKIDAEMKFNGWRSILEVDGSGKTLIYFADTRKNRSEQFPALVSELKAIKGGVILDADFGAVFDNGDPVPRKDLAGWGLEGTGTDQDGKFKTASGENATIVVHVFDILYVDGEDLHTQTWLDRRARLEQLFANYDFKFLQMAEKNVCDSEAELKRVVGEVSRKEGSEGAVCKAVNGDYPLTGQTPSWAKLKNFAEFKVQVIEKIPVKGSPDTFNYRVGYLDESGELAELGKTFNTNLNAPDGAILTIEASELIPSFSEKTGSWALGAVLPRVRDVEPGLKKPETIGQIISRAFRFNTLQASPRELKALRDAGLLVTKSAEVLISKLITGELSIKEGDSGDGVLQTHERGLTEDQAKHTSDFGWTPVFPTADEINRLKEIKAGDWQRAIEEAATTGSAALLELTQGIKVEGLSEDQRRLLAKFDPVSVHTDFRLHPEGEAYWEGGEGFTPGNQFQVNKFRFIAENPEEGSKAKILGTFKLPRVAESRESGVTEPIVRGPLYWLTVGDKKPMVFAPGTEGANTQSWGRITIRDKFKWWAGVQDRHYKEFWLQGDTLDGRWIVGYVPTAAGVRQWMISRPAKQTPDSKFLQEKFGHLAKSAQRSWEINIAKADEEKHLVYGVVLQPEITDKQGDVVSAEAIEQACHNFMIKSRIIGVGHRSFIESADLKIVECYIAPTDMMLGGQKVVKGSWLMTVYVGSPRIWNLIKDGQLTGFSISGSALTSGLEM